MPVMGLPGTSLMLSAVIKSNASGGTLNQLAALGNSSGSSGDTFHIGQLQGNSQYWGLQNSTSAYYASGQPAASGLPAVLPEPVMANVETCLVAQIDFSVNGVSRGLDRMRLWVNPPADRSTVQPDIDQTTAHVEVFSGVSWQTQQGQIVDEISVNSGGGTWERLSTELGDTYKTRNSKPYGVALLLTDGSVLVQDAFGGGGNWYKFAPDVYGNYVNGTWTAVASIPASFNYAPRSFNSAVLPDGRVMVEGAEYNFGSINQPHTHGAIFNPIANNDFGGWTKLTPPPFGDECDVNGNSNFTSFGNTGAHTYWCSVNDGGSVVLPDGTWMVGNSGGNPKGGLGRLQALLPFLYNPTNVKPWIPTGVGLPAPAGGALGDGNTEHGWTLLPSPPGLVALVTVDTYRGVSAWNGPPPVICGGYQSSELYFGTYKSGQWYCLGDTQVQLWATANGTTYAPGDVTYSTNEMGPAVLRPVPGSGSEGTVVQFGANSNTAILGTTKWTAGPSLPSLPNFSSCPDIDQSGPLVMADTPAALLRNGNVLAGPGQQARFDSFGNFYEPPPAAFFELTPDPSNVLVQVPAPNTSNLYGSSQVQPVYYACDTKANDEETLELPTGQIWLTIANRGIEIYTPNNQNYDPALAPVVNPLCSSPPCPIYNNATNTLSGQRFNGMSQGAAFGDEMQSASNYPLVRVTDGGNPPKVYYCRTHDHSSMGVATGNLLVSTSFDCPNLPVGLMGNLQVVANGIPSNAQLVKISSAPAVCFFVGVSEICVK